MQKPGEGFVVPVLLEADISGLPAPLTAFQATAPTEEQLEQILYKMNDTYEDKLEHDQIKRTLHFVYPSFLEKLNYALLVGNRTQSSDTGEQTLLAVRKLTELSKTNQKLLRCSLRTDQRQSDAVLYP